MSLKAEHLLILVSSVYMNMIAHFNTIIGTEKNQGKNVNYFSPIMKITLFFSF